MSARKRSSYPTTPEPVLEGASGSLLDIVDHVLTKGIVLTGDLVLGVADIDLVYLRLSAVLCAADRILGPSPDSTKRRRRHAEDRRPGLVASKIGSPFASTGAPARRGTPARTARAKRA